MSVFAKKTKKHTSSNQNHSAGPFFKKNRQKNDSKPFFPSVQKKLETGKSKKTTALCGMQASKVYNDYYLDESGKINPPRSTNHPTDRLIAFDSCGGEKDSIIVKKGSLGAFVKNEGKLISKSYWGEKKGTYANIKSRADAMKIFKFASDHTNVEWGLIGFKSGENTLGTLYENALVGGLLKVSGHKLKDISFDYHCHPGRGKGGDVASGQIGDQGFASQQVRKLRKAGVPDTEMPKYYIYRPHVDEPYRFEYSPWNDKFNERKVKTWKNL